MAIRLKTLFEKLKGLEKKYGRKPIPTTDYRALYDALVRDKDICRRTKRAFYEGDYADAVAKAFKCIEVYVRDKTGLQENPVPLMQKTFSEDAPYIKLNSLKSKSERNEQVGYMNIFAGCMMGIRAPSVHEHDYHDHPEIALELLVLASHLMKKVKGALFLTDTKKAIMGSLEEKKKK